MTVASQATDILRPMPAKRDRLPLALASGALVLAVLLTYAPCAWLGPSLYDDSELVFENPAVMRGLTWQGAGYAFGLGHWAWHPLTFLSLMLDVQWFGPSPGAMHVTNVLLHATNAVLVLLVMHRLTQAFWPSVLTAALFALHPLRVESVAWISQRKDVLAMAMGLLALLQYAGYARLGGWQRYSLCLLFHALSLMAKSSFVPLPVALLLLDIWPLRRLKVFHGAPDPHDPPAAPEVTLLRALMEKVPLLALSLAATVLLLLCAGRHESVEAVAKLPLDIRLQTVLVGLTQYLRMFAWPAELSILYYHPGQWSGERLAASAVVVLAVTALAAMQVRRRPWLLVGWLWFIVTLLPVSGIVQAGPQAWADRFTYLPSLVFTLGLCWQAWSSVQSAQGQRLLRGVGIALALVLAAASHMQVRLWASDHALWTRALQASPAGNPLALRTLASLAQQQQDSAAALDLHLRWLEHDPSDIEALAGTLQAAVAAGQIDIARACFDRLMQSQPGHAAEHHVLGGACATMAAITGDARLLTLAEQHLRRAAELAPGRWRARLLLAMVLLDEQRAPEALRLLENLQQEAPGDPAVQKQLRRAQQMSH